MKVLLAIDSLMGGGKERQFVELAKGLSHQSDLTVRILLFHEEIHYEEIGELGIPVDIIIRKKKYDPGVYRKVYTFLRKFRPDIVHSWNPMVSVLLLPFKPLIGFRFIEGSIRSAPSPAMIPRVDFHRIRLSSRFADKTVANSHSGLRSYGITQRGMAIYNGFDLRRTENSPENLQRVELQGDCFQVGMVGNFTGNKDYDTFFEAAEIMRKKRPGTKFSAIGGGPNYTSFADKYKDHPEFYIPGRVKEVESLVRNFDICVLCSTEYGEGISNSILEYFSMRKPVIALDCPGNREVIEPGISGLFYLLRDANSLAWNLELLCGDKYLRRKLGQNGYHTLTTKFSMDRMVGSYLALYKQLSN